MRRITEITRMAASILWPMLAYIGWVFMLYTWLTITRLRGQARREVAYGAFVAQARGAA